MRDLSFRRHPFHLAFTGQGSNSPYSFEEFPLGPPTSGLFLPAATLSIPFSGDHAMPSPEYSLTDTLERIYENQLALEAALMELTLLVESQGHAKVGENVRGALEAIGENAGNIKQGLARLKAQEPD